MSDILGSSDDESGAVNAGGRELRDVNGPSWDEADTTPSKERLVPLSQKRGLLDSDDEDNEYDNARDQAAKDEESINAKIFCIFSVVFDESEGPILEWCAPKDLAKTLDGIAFSALASGMHDQNQSDFVYFKWKEAFGMACYKHSFIPGKARQAVMRSIGVLSDHFAHLHGHRAVLQAFTEKYRTPELQKANRTELKEYFSQNGEELSTLHLHESDELIFPSLKTIPAGAVTSLIDTFGVNLFVLWKAMMLRKKILIVADPPLGKLSLITLAAAFLTKNSHESVKWRRLYLTVNPLFYVSVNNSLEVMHAHERFLAFSTERIFESFESQGYNYDVCFSIELDAEKRRNVVELICVNEVDETSLCITSGDKTRYKYLQRRLSPDNELDALRLVHDVNNKLLYGLDEYRKHMHTKKIAPSSLKKFGLDKSDFDFFTEFADVHDLIINYKTGCMGCV